MKFFALNFADTIRYVALFARAWIEICLLLRVTQYTRVALFARAWIEISIISSLVFTIVVALFARAWIEIILYNIKYFKIMVALFARAWIEIDPSSTLRATIYMSPSLRGRGLKS